MAIIKCNECGKQISTDAAFCPHCGKMHVPVNTDNFARLKSIVSLIALILWFYSALAIYAVLEDRRPLFGDMLRSDEDYKLFFGSVAIFILFTYLFVVSPILKRIRKK